MLVTIMQRCYFARSNKSSVVNTNKPTRLPHLGSCFWLGILPWWRMVLLERFIREGVNNIEPCAEPVVTQNTNKNQCQLTPFMWQLHDRRFPVFIRARLRQSIARSRAIERCACKARIIPWRPSLWKHPEKVT